MEKEHQKKAVQYKDFKRNKGKKNRSLTRFEKETSEKSRLITRFEKEALEKSSSIIRHDFLKKRHLKTANQEHDLESKKHRGKKATKEQNLERKRHLKIATQEQDWKRKNIGKQPLKNNQETPQGKPSPRLSP